MSSPADHARKGSRFLAASLGLLVLLLAAAAGFAVHEAVHQRRIAGDRLQEAARAMRDASEQRRVGAEQRRQIERLEGRVAELEASLVESRQQTEVASRERDHALGEGKRLGDEAAINGRLIDEILKNLRLSLRKGMTIDDAAIIEQAVEPLRVDPRDMQHPLARADACARVAGRLTLARAWEPAERLYGSVVGWRREHLGEDDPKTIEAMERQAQCLSELGRFREAVAVHQLVVERSDRRESKRSGADTRRGALARALMRDGRYAEAEPLARRLAAELGWEGSTIARAESVLVNYLLLILWRVGRYDEAAEIARALEAHRVQTGGADSQQRFEAACWLAWMLVLAGRGEETGELRLWIIETAQFQEAIESPFRVAEYGRYLTALGEYERAEAHLLWLVDWRVEQGTEGLALNEDVEALVDLYETWGRPDQAQAWRLRLIHAAEMGETPEPRAPAPR